MSSIRSNLQYLLPRFSLITIEKMFLLNKKCILKLIKYFNAY